MLARQMAHLGAIDDGEQAYLGQAYLESLIRADYERCHPDEKLEDIKRRAAFSKYDKGLLRDWMAVAATRAGAAKGARAGFLIAAE